MTFGLSLACYNVMCFVVLLRHFIYVETIQTNNTDSNISSKVSDYDYRCVENL